MQIEPQVTLPLVYQITNPFDEATYYIRGVISDSMTGELLGTVNLAHQGSGRYTASTLAPKDQYGFGRHIDVVISVYTDAGYSVLSENYQRTIDRYVVKASPRSFGGGGGADVDYDKIERIINAAVGEHFQANAPKETDLTAILSVLAVLQAAVDKIEMPKIPEQKETNLSPVQEAIQNAMTTIVQAIEDKYIPEPEEVDLDPVVTRLEAIAAALETEASAGDARTQQLVKFIQERLDRNSKRFNSIKKLKEAFDADFSEEEEDLETMPGKRPEKDSRFGNIFDK